MFEEVNLHFWVYKCGIRIPLATLIPNLPSSDTSSSAVVAYMLNLRVSVCLHDLGLEGAARRTMMRGLEEPIRFFGRRDQGDSRNCRIRFGRDLANKRDFTSVSWWEHLESGDEGRAADAMEQA